ncbi:MAG: DUF1553 domain-containing protein [Verrucomicrobiales bacterium]|nr:DUF1553 domain-containing protein [Verrucomicrobiales bacterium]
MKTASSALLHLRLTALLTVMAGLCTASAAEAPKPTLSFKNDVLPILSRHGCAGGSCHAKAEGQNGFALSVFAYNPQADYREIVHNARGRRVFPAAPEQSLLILKATNRIDHEGGEMIKPGSIAEKTLLDWIRQGMPWEIPGEPKVERIAVSPPDARYAKGQKQSVTVTAHFTDGSTRDITGLSEFTSPDTKFATVDHDGHVTMGNTPGEGTIVVRYLDHVDIARITLPPDKLQPDSAYAALKENNEIDRYAHERFKKLGILPSELCTDSEFIRRATLDAIGRLPEPERVKAFLADQAPDKRAKLIDELLSDANATAYADYWATKWGDLLRPNTQRVGVKPVYLMDDWIRRKFRENTPWDAFVRELLTAQGSTHQVGPLAIWRDKREPADMAEYVSRIFLGVRLDCAKCHHHPSEKWSQDDYYSLAAFFGSMKRKGQGISAPISGEPEYWWFQPGVTGTVKHPVTDVVLAPKPPEGPVFDKIPAETDPRTVLLDYMTNPEHPQFARAAVNRVWGELFGRGIVHPVDDFRASNPPTNEPLLEWLASDFSRQGYDFKKLLRTVMNSRLYQLSSLPNPTNLSDTTSFSRAYRRRLPAEVMLDAVSDLTKRPETFSGLPVGARAVQQWNHLMRSEFLDAFGRPDSSADCPCERDRDSSVVQGLHLMNSDQLQAKLTSAEGWAASLAKSTASDAELIEQVYLATLARQPTDEERTVALAYFKTEGIARQAAIEDLMWSVVNSAAFVFNH